MQPLIYTGTQLAKKNVTIKRNGQPDETVFPYIPSSDLVKAVNLALFLDRPLLVMGEPGCGKSKLAQAIAYELYHGQIDEKTDKPLDYLDFYQEWFVKSTAKAQEGLYEYDAIRRLADAQIARTEADRNRLANQKYWNLRPMGTAFARSTAPNRRVVLLIDEIDKADLDFPNDLLNELDNARFTISETGDSIAAICKPIVIITSNAEKDLPDAFLRRCLYHYITFDATKLKEIVVSRFHTTRTNGQPASLDEPTNEFIDKAKNAFLAIRQRIEDEKFSLGNKNVSTSEFLDWYKALNHYRTLDNPNDSIDPASQQAIDALTKELDSLSGSPNGSLSSYPFSQVLFKNYATLLSFNKS